MVKQDFAIYIRLANFASMVTMVNLNSWNGAREKICHVESRSDIEVAAYRFYCRGYPQYRCYEMKPRS